MYHYDDRQHPIYVAYRAYLDGDNSKLSDLSKDMQEMLDMWLKSPNYSKSAYQISQETGLSSVLCSELKNIRKRHKRHKRDEKHIKYFAEDFIKVLSNEKDGISVYEISRRVNCSSTIAGAHMQNLERRKQAIKEIKYTRSGKVTAWKAL